MNILFRADSSSLIGIGHIMRDLVLASKYKESNIIFACQDLDGNINAKIQKIGYKVELLKSNDIKEVDNLIKKYNIDFIVIDHYDIDFMYEKELKHNNLGLKILSFDDTYEKHFCDILLNHNIYADEKRYKSLVPKNCELRCGEKYTLLRDEFIEEKSKTRKGKKNEEGKNKENKNIFVAMGGADYSNINMKILEVLKEFDNISVILATTNANKNLEILKEYIKNKKWITLYINSDNIAKLMSVSSFAIITPSVMANEIYFLNIPFIAIQTANNQNNMYEYLKNKNKTCMETFSSIYLHKAIKELIYD